MTGPEHTWELWTAPVDGERVTERPLLHSSALVTILNVQPQAVEVRTAEGVTGWIHAPASEALTVDVSPGEPQMRFIKRPDAQVVHTNAIPFAKGHARQQPSVEHHSTPAKQ